jgi:hypothetical protein
MMLTIDLQGNRWIWIAAQGWRSVSPIEEKILTI